MLRMEVPIFPIISRISVHMDILNNYNNYYMIEESLFYSLCFINLYLYLFKCKVLILRLNAQAVY